MAVLLKVAVAACLVGVPGALAAQVRPMSAEVPSGSRTPAARTEAMGWYRELQQISTRLQAAHDRALRDPALRQARQAFMEALDRAMDRIDPDLPRLLVRAQQVGAQMAAARDRRDGRALEALDREMAQIQARFMNARAAALSQPAIAEQARRYEDALRRGMMRVEPLTEQLLSRSDELKRRLKNALSQE
ncbi:MAG TPA: hypothetical protein VFQ45_04805 [Longimicrobium sp.]|nr:hypothetical protein [Longimicrobium sp.]